MEKIKNIILGIDGGCFESIEHLLKANLLPNLKKIIDEGFSSPLIETIPPVTIPSWPCLFSGMTPEQLGYCWFNNPLKGLFSSFKWQQRSLFSRESMKSFILNVPGTYPAWQINGEMITGMMSPSISTYPPELTSRLPKEWIINGKSIPEVFKAFDMKKQIFLERLKEDYNLLVYVIRVPDSISHHTHLDRNHISNYLEIGYKKIDEFLGEVMNSSNFDNLFIFSDHGLKFYNHEFYINNWLERKGLVKINKSTKQKIFSLIAKVYDYFRPIIKIDYRAYVKAKKRVKELLNKDILKSSRLDKGENASQAIAFSSNVGGLFLHNDDKMKKQAIVKMLHKERRIADVQTSEVQGFPDIFIILNEKYIFNHHSSLFTVRKCNSINHSSRGFFMAFGKNIKNGKMESINYRNVAPTILKLFSLRIPNYMTGKALDIIK